MSSSSKQPKSETVPQLTTPGVIARELDQPLHRILYVLRTRDHIQMSARAGTLRLYDRKAVAMVRHELNSIDAVRTARKLGTEQLGNSAQVWDMTQYSQI